MTDADGLRAFADEIKEEIQNTVDDLEIEETPLARGTALTEVFLGTLFDAGAIEEGVSCVYEDTTGRNRCRVNGYFLSNDKRELTLFLGWEAGNVALTTVSNSQLTDLGYRAARFFDYASRGQFDRFSGSTEALEGATIIHKSRAMIENVKVLIFTDGVARDRQIERVELADTPVTFETYDIRRLHRIRQTGSIRGDIFVDFEKLLGRPLSCLEMKPPQEEYATFLAIFPGDLIYELYETFGAQLLEFNVRSYLQARGKVNKGIQETLNQAPNRFMAYNNGLTATVDEIDVVEFHGETVIRNVRGLQIVNGGQTTASIHRAKKKEKLDLSNVAVPVKITQVQEEKLEAFVPLISKFANTQNVIQVADLSANHPFHIMMEKLAHSTWCPGEQSKWFYERARGSYEVAIARMGTTVARRKQANKELPKTQKFSKTDFAKWLVTWLGKPQQVCKGAQKNFTLFMDDIDNIYSSGREPDEQFFKVAVARGIVFKRVTRVMARLKIPAYRAQIVAYLIAYLDQRWVGEVDFGMIWENQEISQEFERLFERWAPAIENELITSAAGRNVTEWCKKEECWETIRKLNLALPDPLPPELVHTMAGEIDANESKDGELKIGAEDAAQGGWKERCQDTQASIELCKTIMPQQWAEISFWGMSSGRLRDIEWKVARTLGMYAEKGWVKEPSEKQLRRALRAIELAREEGIGDIE